MRPLGITAALALCFFFSASCDEQQDIIHPDFGVSSIDITPPSYVLLVGESVQLSATVVVSNATSIFRPGGKRFDRRSISAETSR